MSTLCPIPVNQPPVFTLVPESLDVIEGDRVELECKAAGKPLPQLIWYKSNKTLTSDSSTTFESRDCETKNEATSSMVISSVDVGHVGKYQVKAFNSVGSVKCEIPLSGTCS